MDLTDTEKAMLAFERQWWKYAAAKATEVERRFGVTSTVYYARLNALLGRAEALEAEPLVVRRLTRLRDQRRAQRAG